MNSDLFLGSQEINRLIKSLDEDGFRRLFLADAISLGLFNNSVDGNFDNFKVEAGTNVGTIKHAAGLAVDSNGLIIYRAATDLIIVTDDSLWYWVKIAHDYSSLEDGIVAIDGSGNLNGVGTEFTVVLRGLPNNPSRISFPDAVLNTGEYDVVEVNSNGSVILAGDFLPESNLHYSVVGTFTPDIDVPTGSKQPFQYDSCTLSLVAETVLDTPPAYTAGQQFYIARVNRTGATVTIQDKRKSYIYRSKADYFLNNVPDSDNPLIGIEEIRFDDQFSPRNKNQVVVAWGMRSSNWTIDANANRVTIVGGNGGKYKSTADFVNGDFDGWRIYTKNGKYSIIKQSTVSALQINLVLDTLDADDYVDTAQELNIVPDAEDIEIISKFLTGSYKRIDTFPINPGYGIIPLEVYALTSCQYIMSYRYKTFGAYSQDTVFPNDVASGYLIETDFNVAGAQTASIRQTYSSGIITLLESPTSYRKQITAISTGDLFGLELLPLDNAANVYDFVVGTRMQNVMVTQDTDLTDSQSGAEFDFTISHYINLRTDLPTTIRDGNYFVVDLTGYYVKGAFNLYIVQDYVSSIDPGTVLYTMTDHDFREARNNNLLFRFIYDAENNTWVVNKFIARNEEYDTIQFVVDGGGTAITTGQKAHYEVPFDCTVVGWGIYADQSGSIVIDIWKDTYANFPPAIGDTITGSEKPTLSSSQKNQDLTLTTWTTTLSKGDILAFNVDSASTVQRVNVVLKVTK